MIVELGRHRNAAARLADRALDFEPLGGAGLVHLLLDRPVADANVALATVLDGAVVGVIIGSVVDSDGFVDLLAVERSHRRRGLGAGLLAALEERLIEEGATSLQAGGSSWYYAWPGVDLRYTPALAMLERHGYRQVDQVLNMTVDLHGWEPRATSVRGGVELRRGRVGDAEAIDAFIEREFTEAWRREAALALAAQPPRLHLALEAGRILGFSCHGVLRPDWFGPIGTAAAARGSGVGEALLRRCLDDQAGSGLTEVQICWIGPRDFYSRTVDARIGRVFAVLRKDVATQ